MMLNQGESTHGAVFLDRFVDDVPPFDAPSYAADHRHDVVAHASNECVARHRRTVGVLKTQRGVWLCQTSVCPMMNMPLRSPNST